MQRNKASASVEVKQVIGALCKLLSISGVDAVPTPETFRRAKFGGGPDVEKHFWQLLASILHKTCTVSLGISGHLKDASESRELVAAGLWQTGFYADWMFRDTKGGEGDENSVSSKHLLLALGWLLAKGTLEKLLSQRVKHLDKTLLTSTSVNLESLQVSTGIEVNPNSLRKLQWCIGRLRHQGRILMSMQEERAQLLHKIFSLPLHVNSSSTVEGSALIKKDCACLQELCELLEAYLKWRQVENIFWTWMDSVVDSHLTDLDADAREPAQAPMRSSVCLHENQGLEKLDDILLQIPQTQKRPGKCKMDSENREHMSDGAQGGFDTSFETPLDPQPSLTQAYRARLQEKKPGRKGCSQHEVSASEACKLLMQTEAQLLMRRDRLRQANRMHLEEMIESLDQVVLIPP